MQYLENFVNQTGKQSWKECALKLDQIFKSAIQLDEEMNMEVAYYYLDLPRSKEDPNLHYGFEFDATTMAVDAIITKLGGRVQSKIVGLVITPTLYVHGDGNGAGLLEDPVVLHRSIVMPQHALMKKPRNGKQPDVTFSPTGSKTSEEKKGSDSQTSKGWRPRWSRGETVGGGD
jgi:hypothetical protein